MQRELFAARAVEDDVHGLLREAGDRRVQVEVIFLRQGVEVHPRDGVAADIAPAAGLDAAVVDGEGRVRDDDGGVDLQKEAEAAALRACTHGIVEREHARRKLRHGDAALVAGVVAGEQRLLPGVRLLDDDEPAAVLQRGLDGIRQAARQVAAQHKAVDHQLDGVLFVLLECDLLAQVIEDAVHAHAGEAALPRVCQQLDVLALFAAHDRGQHLKARALRQGQHLVDDLVDGLAADLAAAARAVRRSGARPQQAQVVVNFRHRAHGRAWVAGRRLLVDGNGGGQAFDHVYVGLVHLSQELPRIGRKRVDIAPPALGIDRVERERRFTGAGKPREYAQRVARDLHIHIFQVVFARTAHEDGISHSCLLPMISLKSYYTTLSGSQQRKFINKCTIFRQPPVPL